jgi:hypothetical protein
MSNACIEQIESERLSQENSRLVRDQRDPALPSCSAYFYGHWVPIESVSKMFGHGISHPY